MSRLPLRMASALSALAALLMLPMAAHADEASRPQCRYVKTVDLPLRYAGPQLVPAVDGSINEKPATLLVDTGAWHTVLTMTGAMRRDMGLRFTGRRAIGIGGISRIYAVHVREIGIGDAHLTKRFDMELVADTASPPDFDAILGAPFLLKTDMLLDLRAKRLAMYAPDGCDKTDLYLWDENTVVVPFQSRRWETVNPHFAVTVNGKTLDAIIDTGAARSVMTLAAAKRIGLDVKGPGAVRLNDLGGIGAERAPHWSVPVAKVQIADETISNVEIGVVDEQGNLSADLLLGQDFLRAHRVLFAMRQEKLYIAYLGGDVFARGAGLEPWVRQEADAGNADAQYVLAQRYRSGQGVPRDRTEANAWLRKAAAGGQPDANLLVARGEMSARRYAEAIPRLRAALDRLPADRYGPLWLYIARLHNGEPDLARSELETSLKRQDNDDWPYPIARLYLGKWDVARVLDEAAKDKATSHARTCQAERYIADWHTARVEDAQAHALTATLAAHCTPAVAVAAPDKTAAAPDQADAAP